MTAVNVRYAEPFRNITPAVSSGPDTQIVIVTLAVFFHFCFSFLFIVLASWLAAPTVRWTRRSWCPFVLYFGDHGSLLPYFVTFQTSPISFIFQTQGYCQYAQLPPCVCMCVCVCACVCVYIYIKRESNIYESIFSYFVMRAIDKKQKKTKSFSFFPQWDTAILFWREVFIFLKTRLWIII